MSKIVFNNSTLIIYEGSFSQIGSNQVRLIFSRGRFGSGYMQ